MCLIVLMFIRSVDHLQQMVVYDNGELRTSARVCCELENVCLNFPVKQ
jgi:hypothetical protein